MKILFVKNVTRQGVVGEVKDVPQGFAQHLIKNGQAVVATEAVIAQNKKKIEEAGIKAKGEESMAHEIAKRVNGTSIEIKGGANNKGSLYKAIHKQDILEALSKKVVVTVPGMLVDDVSIKQTGKQDLHLKYKGKTLATFEVVII